MDFFYRFRNIANSYAAYAVLCTLATLLFASCADDTMIGLEVEKPGSIADYEYLDAYDALKTYVNRTASPGFHLGTGVGATDYNKKGTVYRLTNENFDEMTPGNEMKYASIVSDDGSMDFTTVENFVTTAREAGTTIYGHNLCWQAQQNTTYLNSLVNSIKAPEGNESWTVEDLILDYTTFESFPYFEMGFAPDFSAENGLICVNEGDWIQFFVAGDNEEVATTVGGDYELTFYMKATSEWTANVCMGNWDPGWAEASILFPTEWQEVTVTMHDVPASSSAIILQPGAFVGTLYIKWLKVSHTETSGITATDWVELISNGDFEGDDETNYQANGAASLSYGTGSDGTGRCAIINVPSVQSDDWGAQLIFNFSPSAVQGEKYTFSVDVKADTNATITTQAQTTPGNYLYWTMFGDINATTDWQTFTSTVTITSDTEGLGAVALNLGLTATNYYFDNLSFKKEVESDITSELLAEQRRDTIDWAMEQWVKGMMEACDGYVTAWDVVNEPVSGGDNNGDGIYDLWSTDNNPDASCFYWRDYLGDDFVRVPIKYARQYFAENGGNPSDLKLFVNDYNLESTWDDNQKLKSLIKWIEEWESDGETVIDGIGTQMHVTYVIDEAGQQSLEEHIVQMFELLAATGKLIKISELDIGISEVAFGDAIMTDDVTFEQRQLIAGFYQWIIEKYLEIIPAAQQYGITFWCQTDSPSSSGWRAGEPVGLWTTDYSRTPAYGGVAEGLGKE